MMIRPTFVFFFLLLLVGLSIEAREMTIDDIHDYKLVSRDPIKMRLLDDSGVLIEKVDEKNDHWSLNIRGDGEHVITKSKDVLASLKVLPGLNKSTLKDIKNFKTHNTGLLLFEINKDFFVYDIDKREVRRLTRSPHGKVGEEFSPDGRFLSYIENYNIWLSEVETGATRQVTFDGTSELLYGRLDWVYQEEIYGRGNYKGYWWSPDSQRLAFLKIDESPVKNFPIVDHLHMYGSLYSMNYPKAGSPNPIVKIGVIKAGGGEINWVDLSEYELTQYLIVGLTFDPESSQVIYQVQDRTQKWLHLNAYDISQKTVQRLSEQKSNTWTDRLQENPKWHPEEKIFYFLSYETGYTHIYAHYQENDHWKKKALTQGNFDVKDILHVSKEWIYFSTNKDSLLRDQIYALNIDSKDLVRMTDLRYHHSAQFSKNGMMALVTTQSSHLAPKKDYYQVQGHRFKLVHNLFTPNTDRLDEIDRSPVEYLTFSNRHGEELQAFMIKPKNFNPKKKYKVLSYVYSGPKIPSILDRFNVSFQLWHQYMAQKGYVIWAVDSSIANSYGHETAAKCYERLGTVELEDLEDGVEFLKSEFPWIDHNRIGLWGWSYGGYMTSYALTHSTTFKTGAAVAPLLDWGLYDSIYAERYMNTPQANQEGYQCSNVLECAEDLNGDYLLIHGTMDDNVHMQNALKMVHELTKHRKQFQLMLYPDNEHSIRTRRAHLFDTLTRFFDDKL